MKKNLRIVCAVLLAAFTLGACSITPTITDYKGHTVEDLENTSVSMIEQLDGMSTDDIESALESFKQQVAADPDNAEQYNMYIEMMENWLDITSQCGEFGGYGDFTVEKTGKTVTTKQEMHFTNRDARFIIVYNYLNMKPKAMNAEIIYSLSETMSRAFMNLLMGMGIVFAVLILIALVIYAFNIFPYLENKRAQKNAAAPAAEVAAAAPVAALPQSPASDMDDMELVAVITAAIAASTGAATDSFVVRSIKRRF